MMDGKILRPDFQEKNSISITHKAMPCKHLGVEVEEYTRTVSCAKCEAILDPFTVVFQFAIEERKLMVFTETIKKARSEIVELKQEEKRIKARISRAKLEASKQGVLF